jgi:hypothetical protein
MSFNLRHVALNHWGEKWMAKPRQIGIITRKSQFHTIEKEKTNEMRYKDIHFVIKLQNSWVLLLLWQKSLFFITLWFLQSDSVHLVCKIEIRSSRKSQPIQGGGNFWQIIISISLTLEAKDKYGIFKAKQDFCPTKKGDQNVKN